MLLTMLLHLNRAHTSYLVKLFVICCACTIAHDSGASTTGTVQLSVHLLAPEFALLPGPSLGRLTQAPQRTRQRIQASPAESPSPDSGFVPSPVPLPSAAG